MKNKHLLLMAVMAMAAVFVMTACKKSNSADTGAGKQQLSLYLTDGPGFFDHVYIDIRSVKVLVDTSADTRRHDNEDWNSWGANEHKKDSSLIWEDLGIQAGIYDILNFRNGADTLLANAGIAKGSIRLIKIEIGTDNSLVKDSITYPVTLPAGVPNYILIKLRGHECEQYMPGRIRLWLDFDIGRSIIQGSNNKFILRPIFHFFVVSNTGAVAGRVIPRESYPVITVFNTTDTAYALPNKEGYFKVRGLNDGTYSVFINGSNGYFDSTITNISVKAPGETSLGSITLRK